MLAVFFSLSLSLNGKNSVNAKLIIIASGDLSDTYCFNLRRIGIRLCWQPFCSLHLHLEMSENPYTSGPITSKKSVPGIIVATGRAP